MSNKEYRLHDLTYAEIVELFKALEKERDMWRAKAEGREPVEEPKKPSIVDSVDFVVDMMNSGGANPDRVYPRNRYHGD